MPDKKDFIMLFKAEAGERLNKINNGLVELENNPQNLKLIKDLNREAHTIKGSSAVFGFTEIQDIAHRIEDAFEEIVTHNVPFNAQVANTVFQELDAIKACLEKIGEEPKETATQIPRRASLGEVVRVRLDRVDTLLNLVGEMVISKLQASEKLNKIKKLSKLAKEAQGALANLSAELKNKFSLSGSEAEKMLSLCAVNAQRLSEESLNLYEHLYTEALYLDPIIDELQNRAKELRMFPCATIFEGFPRMLRDIALTQGKEINLEIFGEDAQLDKKVLEGLRASLVHILRNCVDHGIETTQERKALGKPEAGRITLSMSEESAKVTITVEDDGKGIDLNEVKETVIKKALVAKEALEKMSEKEILNLIFMNGYSTSQVVTEVSGRGIGLDVVRRDIESLRGEVAVRAEKGKGMKLSLILPLTIAVSKALLIKVNGMTFAFPLSSVSECVDASARDIATLEGGMCIQVRERLVPLVRLNDVLRLHALHPHESETSPRETSGTLPAVIAHSFEKKVGFLVDEIITEEDIFVKPLGPHLGKVKNVSGATILGTGEVVVILDVADLISSCVFNQKSPIDAAQGLIG